MRHEETFQSARSRQHRSRIVDKQIDFFLLIVSMGQSLASQGEPGAPRAPKASHPERPGHPARAIRGQLAPARASQKRPGPPNRLRDPNLLDQKCSKKNIICSRNSGNLDLSSCHNEGVGMRNLMFRSRLSKSGV